MVEVFLICFLIGFAVIGPVIGVKIGSWLAYRWANKIARERGLPEFK